MQYIDFKGEKLSALGFGAMRLPVIDGNENDVDETATFEMVDYAVDHGVGLSRRQFGTRDGPGARAV